MSLEYLVPPMIGHMTAAEAVSLKCSGLLDEMKNWYDGSS